MTTGNKTRSRRSITFIVRIVGTENGTWQGQLAHAISGHTYTFSSCLELIQLMNEYVQGGGEVARLEEGSKTR